MACDRRQCNGVTRFVPYRPVTVLVGSMSRGGSGTASNPSAFCPVATAATSPMATARMSNEPNELGMTRRGRYTLEFGFCTELLIMQGAGCGE